MSWWFLWACAGAPVTADAAAEPGEVSVTEIGSQPVELELPYMPWQQAYERVRADAALAAGLEAMVAALSVEGSPGERLKAMDEAASAARVKVAAAGGGTDMDFGGLDTVQVDLQLAFVKALSEAVGASSASAEDKRAALEALLAAVRGEHGVPEADERKPWTATARITAETLVEVQLEGL